MARLPILEFPDPRLRTKARPVPTVNARVQRLIDDMLETMYEAPGIGLAATQVDVHQRIIVIDISEDHDAPLVLVNPQIEIFGDEVEASEGCLSVPGFYEMVTRPASVRLQALDRSGTPYTLAASGLLAQCIQHECEHLDGRLFVDHISALKRQRIRRKLEKQRVRA